MENKDTIIKTKKREINFLSMWKDFWNPETQEKTEEEKILEDGSISDKEKKELLKALKGADKLSNTLFRESYKVTKLERSNLKDDAKVSLEQSKVKKQGKSDKTPPSIEEKSQKEIVD